jgi:MFS family permease
MNPPTEPSIATGKRNEWLLVVFAGSMNIADAIMTVSLPLLTLQLTRSAIAVTAVATMLTLPWLLTALHVGVFVDRVNRRSLVIGANAARITVVGVLMLAVLGDAVSLPLIYGVALALGIADVVATLSGASILPAAVPRSRWQTANTRVTAAEYLSNSFIGAPIGGLLVAAGFAFALATTASVYLLGAVLLMLLVGKFGVITTQERRPVHSEIRDGLTFLWHNRLLRTMAGLITVMAGCWAAWFALIPLYAVGGPLGLSASQYGFLLTSLGAGGVAGTVLVGPLNRLVGRRWSMFLDIIGSFALLAAPALLPATPGSAWAIGAAAFLAGAGGTMWTVNSRVIFQTQVPDELRGRTGAASMVLAWGMAPVGAAASGVLAQLGSPRMAFAVFAVLCLALAHPFLRVVTRAAIAETDQPTEAEQPAAAGRAS